MSPDCLLVTGSSCSVVVVVATAVDFVGLEEEILVAVLVDMVVANCTEKEEILNLNEVLLRLNMQ